MIVNGHKYEHATVTIMPRDGGPPFPLEGVKSISYGSPLRSRGALAFEWEAEALPVRGDDHVDALAYLLDGLVPMLSRYEERRLKSWRTRANRKIRRRFGAWCRLSRAVRLGLVETRTA